MFYAGVSLSGGMEKFGIDPRKRELLEARMERTSGQLTVSQQVLYYCYSYEHYESSRIIVTQSFH